MASTMIPTATRNSTAARNKKKKKLGHLRDQNQNVQGQEGAVSWKSEVQQQVYSSKLLQALRQVRNNNSASASTSSSSSTSAPKRGRAVRDAAYRVLAVAAKGRTRWSRAILTNRLKLKFIKKSSNRRMQRASAMATGPSRLQKKSRAGILRLKTKNSSAVQRKVKFLSRLVPGCRKQPLPIVLEEATDYIAALEMQVRAMSALAELLSGTGISAGSSNAGIGPINDQLHHVGSSRPPPTDQ